MSLSPFLPLTLRNMLTPGKGLAGEPCFLDGTTLFADISGFTPLSEALTKMGKEGSEYLTRTLNDYFDAIIQRLARMGGDVMRFAGDAVTVYFPGSFGEESAVSAAQAIQNYMTEHHQIHSPVGEFSIRMKIGIASGRHVFMAVGRGSCFDYVFAGDPVDGAAEAEHHAEAGDIILHPVCQGSGGSFYRIPHDRSLGDMPDPVQSPVPDDASCKDFLPSVLTEKIQSGHTTLLNEHRRTTILFVSFGGVRDYENLEELKVLNELYAEVRGLIDGYEGFLNKVDMGDKGSKFLISFGAPVCHEDDEERAVHASEELIRLAKTRGIPMSIGINTATVFSGILGSSTRCEYTVMGDGVNLAARLMQLAGDDQIIVSETVRQGAPSYTYQALPPAMVKGKSQPIPLYVPLERGKGQSVSAEFFVGRKEELQTACRFLEALQGEPGILTVGGSAGSGKSSFYHHLKDHLGDHIHFFSGDCQPFTAHFPYHPWKKILSDLLHHLNPNDSTNPDIVWSGLIMDLYPELAPFTPLLLDLLQIDHDLDMVEADEQTRKSVLHRQIEILLTEAARLHPVSIVIDNLQWLDEESMGLFLDILKALEKPSPSFILLGREGFPDLAGTIPVKEISPGPLASDEVKDLLVLLLGVKRIPERLIQDITGVTSGHPLLVKEAVRTYLESGYITRDEDHPEILHLDSTRRPSMPATLEDVVMARFDKQPAQQQAFLKILSVFGDSVPEELTSTVLEHSGIPDRVLTELVAGGVFLTHEETSGLFSFTQTHIRTTIYDSLDFASRKQFHALAAREYGDYLPDEYPEKNQILAFHYMEAQNFQDGLPYIVSVADRAYDSFAFPSAIHHYQVLLDSRELLDKEQFARILYRASDSLIKLGRFTQVQDLLNEEQLGQVAEGSERGRLYRIAADAYRNTGNFPTAESCLEKALQQNPEDEIRFQVLSTRGTMLATMSRFSEAFELFENLISTFSQKVPEVDIMRTASVRGPLFFVMGNREKALNLLSEAKDYFLDRKEVFTAIRILNNLAVFYSNASENLKALETFLESKKYQEDFGINQFLTITLNEIGYESMLLGRWKDAQYYLNYAVSLCKRFGDPFIVKTYSNLAELDEYLGLYDLARATLKEASRISYEKKYLRHQLVLYWIEFLADIHYPKALVYFLKTLQREIEREHANYMILLHDAYLAQATYLTGDYETAGDLADRTYREAAQTGKRKEQYLARRILHLIHSETGSGHLPPEDLEEVAESSSMNLYRIDAAILKLSESYDETIAIRCRGLLQETPFANLAWKFHTHAAIHLGATNPELSVEHLKTARAFYNHILDHLPWPRIRQCFESQSTARKLRNLSERMNISETAPLPAIYTELTE